MVDSIRNLFPFRTTVCIAGATLAVLLISTLILRVNASAAPANIHYRSVGALRLEETAGATDVVAGDLVLASVSEREAERRGTTSQKLAAGILGQIEHSAETALSASVLMLLCLAGVRMLDSAARYTK